MSRGEMWLAALLGSLVLCFAAFLVLHYGPVALQEYRLEGKGEPLCHSPPRRDAGTVLEVSPSRLVLDQGKRGTLSIGFVCDPPVCAQLNGIAKGDKVEAIFGGTFVSGRAQRVNKLLRIRVGEPEDVEADFEPAPCLDAATIEAVSRLPKRDGAPWPKKGIFAGYYRFGFEVSDFWPAGTKERWWLSRLSLDPTSLEALNRCSYSAPCYVVVRGELSGRGWHGHLGAYDRELTATEAIEQRPLDANEKVRFD